LLTDALGRQAYITQQELSPQRLPLQLQGLPLQGPSVQGLMSHLENIYFEYIDWGNDEPGGNVSQWKVHNYTVILFKYKFFNYTNSLVEKPGTPEEGIMSRSVSQILADTSSEIG